MRHFIVVAFTITGLLVSVGTPAQAQDRSRSRTWTGIHLAAANAADAAGVTFEGRMRASAVRLATERAVEMQSESAPSRRRSMARTWGGVGLIVAGLLMPVQQETCLTLFGFTDCVTKTYTPGVAAAVGLIGTGTLLATIWSDVPANSVGFAPLPGGGRFGARVGF